MSKVRLNVLLCLQAVIKVSTIVQFKKISIPTPWLVNGNSLGLAGWQKPKILKESMKLHFCKLEF